MLHVYMRSVVELYIRPYE